MQQWQRQKKTSPKCRLKVTFFGEAGIDTGALNKEFLTAVVLHSTMRVIPVLDQLRKGLLLYDLPKIMKSYPDLCLPLFVPGDDDKVDTAFILEKCHPLFRTWRHDCWQSHAVEDGTGTPALPSEKKDFDLTVKFNHDCDIHHTVCFPPLRACTRTVTFPSAHLKTPEEFKNIMQLAMHHGESFDRV
ncbi:hypothetical protein AMEX_G12757 [Astyanax mexicanus]|uniref:HECT domain-containing protein n=1 Tax=Astyanax mexicanus TaxID=7994 RepID=A0A8T2LW33_ASTMX|nr:hypothetical protein AMEX_G12757 [Astyanax mexicanus]